MSDDIARQRFWSENARKPDAPRRHPRVPRSRPSGRGQRPIAEPTHVLMVRPHGHREWCVVADRTGSRIRDVSGSEAFVRAQLARRSRHFPADEFRASTWPDARRELRRKTWSVNDSDHIPDGERVMLAVSPAQLHPSLVEVRAAFALPIDGAEQRRTGIVNYRDRRTGRYMVSIDGSGLSVAVDRADLMYPVPDVIVFRQRKVR